MSNLYILSIFIYTHLSSDMINEDKHFIGLSKKFIKVEYILYFNNTFQYTLKCNCIDLLLKLLLLLSRF